MSSNPRPGSARRPRQVGQPNVLSDAAVPNQLSNTAAPSSTSAPQVSQLRPDQPRPTERVAGSTKSSDWLGTGQTAPRPRIRLSLSTLLFLGFIGLTLVRGLGQLFTNDPSGDPAQTTGPRASQAVAPGSITFGTGPAGDCTVVGVAVTFAPGTEVWWSAEMATTQAADADAVVIVTRNGDEVHREFVPAEPSFGTWTTLCATSAIPESLAGQYRVEVWDGKLQTLQSVGEYALKR